MNKYKEIKVAVFVLLAGSMLYMGFNFLKGIDFFSTTQRFYAVYDHVEGLTVSNPVVVNGLNVGRVGEIAIMNNAKQSLQVAVDIDKNVLIGDSTIAMISSISLIGGKCITIKLGNTSKLLPEKSMLISQVERSPTDELKAELNPIIENLSRTFERVNDLISKKNTDNIADILANLGKTTQVLNKILSDNGRLINKTANQVTQLTGSLIETEKQLKPILQKANSFADSLNKMKLNATINKANLAVSELNTMLENLNKGNGTAGKLLHNDSLYSNLNNSAKNLDLLMIDLKVHPKRYVHFSLFGNKKEK